MQILVSACLMGVPCRYDGTGKAHAALAMLEAAGHTLVPICPEVAGGLPIPRAPAERRGDGRIITRDGDDVTLEFIAGADAAVKLAKEKGCTLAVMKERSPSCGCREIYDGTFTHTLVPGMGSAARRLHASGLSVLGETELTALMAAGSPL